MNGSGEAGWAGWLARLEEEAKGAQDSGWRERIANRILDKARVGRGQTVLDLGAGTGFLTLRAARIVGPSGKVIALDESAECLKKLDRDCACEGIGNVETVRARVEHLPLDSAVIDAVVCRSALCYSDDLEGSVAEMVRVLPPGGRFSVFEPLPGELSWSGGLGGTDEDFSLFERILKERRATFSLDRAGLRRAFDGAASGGFESLVVHFTLMMEGRSEEDILGEYLYDLPRGLSAFEVLKGSGLKEERIVEVARSFARAAGRGEVKGRLPCLFVWGAKE